MRAGLGVALVCFVSTLVYCAGAEEGATQVWDGRIDKLALFDRALTAEEIAALYRTAQEEIARSR